MNPVTGIFKFINKLKSAGLININAANVTLLLTAYRNAGNKNHMILELPGLSNGSATVSVVSEVWANSSEWLSATKGVRSGAIAGPYLSFSLSDGIVYA